METNRTNAKGAAPVNKLKRGLVLVVFLYLLYAISKEGPTTELVGLLLLLLFVSIMQWWMKSDLRRRMKEKQNDEIK